MESPNVFIASTVRLASSVPLMNLISLTIGMTPKRTLERPYGRNFSAFSPIKYWLSFVKRALGTGKEPRMMVIYAKT